jgi:hypothetical protein
MQQQQEMFFTVSVEPAGTRWRARMALSAPGAPGPWGYESAVSPDFGSRTEACVYATDWVNARVARVAVESLGAEEIFGRTAQREEANPE